jgi:hypothetical protein
MGKQSFTYSGDFKTKRDAMRKAKKLGYKTFSDLVETLLKEFVLLGSAESINGKK